MMEGPPYFLGMITGIVLGSLARLYMLRIDYRHYPTYPHGYASHMAFGFIGSVLGAVALPALLAEDYVAVTFLSLAAQQFREIRNIERESLLQTEATELVPRGSGYIEGISRLFEARNYLAMLVSLISTASYILGGVILAIPTGVVAAYILNRSMYGQRVGDLARIKGIELLFVGPNIQVGEEIVMNVGEGEGQELWQKEGIALAIEPIDDNARATLSNQGQRQAILHDCASQMGVRLDLGQAQFTPLIRIELRTGRLLMIMIPAEPDIEPLIQAVQNTPVLEAAVRKPLESSSGRKAAD